MAQKRWKREQFADAIRQGQMEVSRLWRPHRSVQAFLADYFPDRWTEIQYCGSSFTFREDAFRPGTFKRRVRYRCHNVPYCLLCTSWDRWRRVASTLDNFHRCTPAGKQPRFIGIVQTAPLTEEGEGWGLAASKDVPAFGRVVWQALKETYGDGIGAVMSYQDFGERGFKKRHPHMDLTLNGWMLQDGEPVQTPRISLAGQGRRQWDERVQKYAQTIEIGAQRGDAHFIGPIVGIRPYVKVMKYKMREMVDLRKLEYSRDKQCVWWWDYKSKRRTRMEIHEFLEGFFEYQGRLGAWQRSGRVELHRGYGHLAKGQVKQTCKVMGGSPIPHGVNCVCEKCGDWYDAELDEEEEAMNEAFRLKAPGKD